MRDIGKNIREIRQRKNLTQDQLAQRLFVTRQTISNYETGRSRPDIETLLALARELGCAPDHLLYGPPGREERRAAWLQVMAGVVALAALAAAGMVLRRQALAWQALHYQPWPTALLGAVLVPAWLLAGVVLAKALRLCGLSLTRPEKRVRQAFAVLALVLGLLNLPWAAAAALDGLGLTAGAAGWVSGIPLYGAAVRLAARFPALHRGLCLAAAAAWELLRPCKEKNAQ